MAEPLTTGIAHRRARNLTDFAVQHVRQQIESGALRPHDRLPTESQLMAALGVSRTVVREAISRLQASGVVETRHGIGSFVLQPESPKEVGISVGTAATLRDLMAILELRMGLETECAGLAAARAQASDIQQMRAALDAIEACARSGAKSTDEDLQFHIAVARATGNQYFVDILKQMGSALIPRSRVNSASIAHADPGAYVGLVNMEHENILSAIAGRDSEGARAAMRTHLSNSRERLRRAYPQASEAELDERRS